MPADHARGDHAALGDARDEPHAGRRLRRGERRGGGSTARIAIRTSERHTRRAYAASPAAADTGSASTRRSDDRGRAAHRRLRAERRRQQARHRPVGRQHVASSSRAIGDASQGRAGRRTRPARRPGSSGGWPPTRCRCRASARPRAAPRAPARRPRARALASAATGLARSGRGGAPLASSPASSSSASRPDERLQAAAAAARARACRRGSSVMCPNSPPKPCAPRNSSPRTMMPAPTPISPDTYSTSLSPRAVPSHSSASAARLASLSAASGNGGPASRSRSSSTTATSFQPRFGATSSAPVAASTSPGSADRRADRAQARRPARPRAPSSACAASRSSTSPPARGGCRARRGCGGARRP